MAVQLLVLRKMEDNRFTVVGVYADDGYSGLYMYRPDFQRMLGNDTGGTGRYFNE